MPLTTEQKTAFVTALRSGEYPQSRGSLHHPVAERGFPAGYCCLGVACVVLGFKIHDNKIVVGEAPELDYKPLDPFITSSHRSCMVDMNDQQRKSFSEIADWVNTNL